MYRFEIFFMPPEIAQMHFVGPGWTWCLVDEDVRVLGWARKTFADQELVEQELGLVVTAEIERTNRAKLD